MPYTVTLGQTGAPSVLELREIPHQQPGPTEALIAHEAIGVNYLDAMQRRGAAPIPLPGGLGLEGAGRVTAVGSAVTNVNVGDRVAYILGPLGSYSSERCYPAERLVRLPVSISFEAAAASLFKGITAQYLLKSTYPVAKGTIVLAYGAAGALGQILVPWAKHLGACVVGVVSKEASVARARARGCDEVLVWGEGDLAAQLSRITNGEKAHVVYDGVGRDTFAASLDSLRSRGLLASIGASSGAPPAVEVSTLNQKGSLFLTRPALAAHATDIAEYRQRAADVFAAIADGVFVPEVWKTYPLAQAAEAHLDIETRKSAGAIVLRP